MLRWLRCLLGRHEGIAETSPDGRRLRLRCVHCLRVSPGWEIARGVAKQKPAAKVLMFGVRKRA